MNGSNSDSNTIEYNKIDDGTIIHIIVTKISDYKVHVRKSKGSYVYERDIDIQISFNRMKSIYNLLNKISERLSGLFIIIFCVMQNKDYVINHSVEMTEDKITIYKISSHEVEKEYELDSNNVIYYVNERVAESKNYEYFPMKFSDLFNILNDYTNNDTERIIIVFAFLPSEEK